MPHTAPAAVLIVDLDRQQVVYANAAAIALTFVAAPAAHADKPSSDGTSNVTKSPKKDSGWG